jgi:hypothetical protein
MIPAGIVNALVQWATGDAARIAQLVARRDAIIVAMLAGDPSAVASFMAATLNGKNVQFFQGISVPEQLVVLTTALENLGELDVPPPSITYGNFSRIQR